MGLSAFGPVIFSKGGIAPPWNEPKYVTLPDCWVVHEGDGQRPAYHLHDYDLADRAGTSLGETGEWYPAGNVGSDGRVSPPKTIVNLQGTPWLPWIRDILGDKNFELKGSPGDGTEDTNDGSIPVFLPDGSINPDKPRKQMSCVTGGAILNVIDTIYQGGVTWDVFQTFDFYNQPVKVGGTWFVDGRALSWENAPQLFTSRVNRKEVKYENRTWLSSRGVQAVSDGGLAGAKLKEYWPNPTKGRAALPRFERRTDGTWITRIGFFPELPAKFHFYGNSVITDGVLTPQLGGAVITVDAYGFAGSKVYFRNAENREWILGEEMLVRADLSTGFYARATDWRCYVTLPGSPEPLRGERGYGIPDPGLFRKDLTFAFWVRAFSKYVLQRFGFLKTSPP